MEWVEWVEWMEWFGQKFKTMKNVWGYLFVRNIKDAWKRGFACESLNPSKLAMPAL